LSSWNLYLHFKACGILYSYSFAEPLTEDYCGVEPVTHPPDVIETRPPPVVDEDKLRQIYQRTDSAILGGKIIVRILKGVTHKHFISVLRLTFVVEFNKKIIHWVSQHII
jgi:hypothetical protein